MLYPNYNDLVSYKDRKLGLMHPSKRSAKSSMQGNYHSSFRGQGLEFDSVREYVPGDDIRNIDWRVTARTGSPHLKLFKEERERHIVICVDMNATMRFGTKNTFKSVQAARIASLLGWQGIDHQDRISVCLFGDVSKGIQFYASKRTRKSFYPILKLLSEPPLEQHHILLENAFNHLNKFVHSGSLIYLISDFIDINKNFEMEANFTRLNKKCGVVFIAVNDQADKTMFPLETIQFCRQKEKIYINTISKAGREAYLNQWNENRKKLVEISSRLKIPIIEMTTESDIHKDLFLGLKSLSKRKKK